MHQGGSTHLQDADATRRTGALSKHASPGVHAVATLLLAAVSVVLIVFTTTMSSIAPTVTVVILGLGTAATMEFAPRLSLRSRVVSALALLSAGAGAFVPGLLSTERRDLGPALLVAVGGSLPMWAIAVWRLRKARRTSTTS